MKITILIDNMSHPVRSELLTEHGLSIYIETEQAKVLLDVGASDNFLHNAKALGIDIADVDYLVLSHAHSDHTGGLAAFLQYNTKAKVLLSSEIRGGAYYSTRRGAKRDISIDYQLLNRYAERFVSVDTDMQLTPALRIIANIPTLHALPKANAMLLADDALDTFNHEIALRIEEDGRSVLLSSCTHRGLLNTLEATDAPDIFIGGLHLVDSDENNTFESLADLQVLSEAIKQSYPNLQIYTSHCTGLAAFQILTEQLPCQLHQFHTGLSF